MPAGRPLKYKTEQEMCDDIERHIEQFCFYAFDAKYINHTREKYLSFKRFGANTPRIDFEIVTDKGIFLIECKNPYNVYSEMTRAVSQLLSYGVLSERDDAKLVLATTATVPTVQNIIYKYELPIMVVYVSDGIAVWDIDTENRIKAGDSQVVQYAIPQ